MKTIPELRKEKERQIQQLQMELDAIRMVERMLEEGDSSAYQQETAKPNPVRAVVAEHRFP